MKCQMARQKTGPKNSHFPLDSAKQPESYLFNLSVIVIFSLRLGMGILSGKKSILLRWPSNGDERQQNITSVDCSDIDMHWVLPRI